MTQNRNSMFSMNAAACADGAFSCAANVALILGAMIMASIFVVRVNLISLISSIIVLVLVSLLIMQPKQRLGKRHLLCA